MAQGESVRATCPNDILITLLNGEKGFEQIVKALSGKYSRGTINKYLNELYDSNLIARKGRRGPYVLTLKGRKMAEREAFKAEIDEASPQEIERIRKRLEYQKLLSKFYRMLTEPLPKHAIIKKLEKLGFNPEDYKIFHTNVCEGEIFDEYSPDDIELFIIPQYDERYIEVDLAVHEPFRLAAYSKSAKNAVYAAYKELINLDEQLEKMRVDMFKEEFELSEEDFKNANPKVLERLSDEYERWLYVASKKPNAYEKFLKHYMREGFAEKIARRLIENEFRFYQTLEKEAKEG